MKLNARKNLRGNIDQPGNRAERNAARMPLLRELCKIISCHGQAIREEAKGVCLANQEVRGAWATVASATLRRADRLCGRYMYCTQPELKKHWKICADFPIYLQ
jgi:hypothetical protein